jgi:lactoylglutathione lyase
MLGCGSSGRATRAQAAPGRSRVALEDVLGAPARLRDREVTPISFFGGVTDEPSVIGWVLAAAVYFRDPAGHQLQYLAVLAEEPGAEVGVMPCPTAAGTACRLARLAYDPPPSVTLALAVRA